MRIIYLLTSIVLSCLLTTKSFAQMPDCLNSGGFVYIHSGSSIYNWDPNLPISATNPSLNTINCPGQGLAVSDYLGPGGGYKTFYTVVGGVYWYYDGTAWVSTGHTVGNGAAVNPGAGGGFIYNLVGGSGEVYKYDGTGNGTLLTTVAGFAGGGPYDLVADKDGNWYILRLTLPGQYLRKYDPNGVLLKEWTINAPSTSAGGGFAIVCNELYYHANTSSPFRGIIGDSVIEVVSMNITIPSPGDFGSCELGIGAPSGGADTNFSLYRGCLPGTVNFNIEPSEDTTFFNLRLSGTAQYGLDYAPFDTNIALLPFQTNKDVEIAALLRSPSVGDRTLVIEVIGDNPCLGGGESILRTINVTIKDSLEVAITSPPVTICPGDTVRISATKDPTLDHTWSPQSLLRNTATLNVESNPMATTTYSIRVTQPNAPSTCPPRTVFYTATVEPVPQITMPDDLTICLEDSITLAARVVPASQNYDLEWSPANGLSSTNELQPRFFEPTPGAYTKTLTATSPIAKCSDFGSMTIYVAPEFAITDISNDTTIYYGDTAKIYADGLDAYMWKWTPNYQSFFNNEREAWVHPRETTTYTVHVWGKYGCFDTKEVTVNVIHQSNLFIPTAFSPNGDGLNDVFKVEGMTYERMILFQVFDRYGGKVFESTNNNGWNGTYNNDKMATSGVYYYFIQVADVDDKIHTFKGDISLIK